VGSKEEALDLSPDEMAKVLELAKAHKVASDATSISRLRELYREVRPSERGLLLIYLIHPGTDNKQPGFVPSIAISFPTSETAQPLSYTVAESWRQLNGLLEEVDG
jgi:hypothetical protein